MAGYNLEGYVEVRELLRRFFDRYPDGSLQASEPDVVELDGKRFLAVTVTAYRNPADDRPAVASAWEPWPGRTPYTKDSEAMNAETSAAGRALRFLGLGVGAEPIATVEDVQRRQADRDRVLQVRRALARHATTVAAKRELVELIVGREPVADIDELDADELDTVGIVLAQLTAGTARVELDEAGAARIVEVADGQGELDVTP